MIRIIFVAAFVLYTIEVYIFSLNSMLWNYFNGILQGSMESNFVKKKQYTETWFPRCVQVSRRLLIATRKYQKSNAHLQFPLLHENYSEAR